MPSLSRLTLNQKLAIAACVLGAVALFAQPYQGSTVRVDTKALAVDMSRGADQVDPQDLAVWILAGRADYRLIDIRSDAAYAAGRIPTAEHVPAAVLMEAGLARPEKIVLYGDDGTQSAQAWLLLRAQGFRGTRLLKGGFAAWQEQVVFPVLAANPTPELRAEHAKRAAIAAYFGGQARLAGQDVSVTAFAAGAPAAAVAPPPPPAAKPAAKKKKKEGC